MKFLTIPEIIRHPGLRIVIVKDFPSPWSLAARAIFDWKGLDYVVGPQLPGGENAELVAWSSQNSGPVVAYADEPPIHRWLDILLLGERLAPEPSVFPRDGEERVRVVGLTNEVAGEGGIGWWVRIAMFHPGMTMDEPPEPLRNMAAKWRYSAEDAARAPGEVATRLSLLADELKRSRARGSRFFVGDAVSALDFHWAAMSVLLVPASEEVMPLLPGARAMFELPATLPEIRQALDPALIEHRDEMLERFFSLPFDYSES